MRISPDCLAILALAMCGACTATAAPKPYELPAETAALKAGPGVETAQNNCTACHSVDYVNFQPPKKGETFWNAEVQRMIKVFHAPIDEADAKIIADYPAKTYWARGNWA